MKYALITGAAGGLAKEICNSIKDDFIIFALDKSNDILNIAIKDKIISYVCDLTNIDNIKKIKDSILKQTNHLDLIVNFAGIVILGSVLEISSQEALNVFNVNLMSMYNVNQIFYEMLDETSRIINVSSEYGKLNAVPFHSFYSASKHAIEIYNDSLRRELLSKKIKVIKIRPGAFKTNMQQNIALQFQMLVNETKIFKEPLLKMKFLMDNELKKAKDCKYIVKTFKKAIYSKHPKIVYNINNSFKMKLLSCLPNKVQDKIYKTFLK